MPELDVVSIVALASFSGLVIAWLFAPMEAVTTVSVARHSTEERVAA